MYLAVDVGGTKTLLASFEETGGAPVKEVRFPTPKTYEQFLSDFERHVKELAVDHFTAAAAGVPGRIDRITGSGISFGNLGWKNTPIKSDFEKMLSCPVYVENDAKVGGLSEAMNVIDDFKEIVYITLGTGIGVTYIKNGVIDVDYGDRGGKAVLVEHDGEKVEWESIASGSAITRRFGRKATDITDTETWSVIAEDLARGLSIVIQEKLPQAVIIGGGAGQNFDRYGELLKEDLHDLLGEVIPVILPAKHADEAVIYGCVDLIKQNHG